MKKTKLTEARINIALPQEQKDEIEKKADSLSVSVSHFIRVAAQEKKGK